MINAVHTIFKLIKFPTTHIEYFHFTIFMLIPILFIRYRYPYSYSNVIYVLIISTIDLLYGQNP
jgi:hypothetical protein